MSDVFDPESELNQDPIGQDSVETPVMDGSEAVDESQPEKKSLKDSFLSMDIFNAMLLLSLVFIFLATLNMLGVLRSYSGSFPFGGFPWSTNL